VEDANMTRRIHLIAALLTIGAALLFAGRAEAAGSWQNGAPFGSTLQGDLYTPSTPAKPAAILVAIHMCTGHSSVVHGWFDSYADQHGFYIIAPDAGKQCFDSSATRSGDRAAIVTMVNYVISNKGGDKSRVFAAGMSSGGCMTNTLLAIYPDVFAGGSAMPGFPAGGWPAGDTTCTKCGSQPPSTSGTYWANIAKMAFMWSGTYPCSQQWVGGGDQYNFNGWLPAVAAQFQTLGNLGAGMTATGRSGWTRTEYKDSAGNVRLQTNLGPTSQMHDLETVMPTLYGDVVTFLGLDQPTGACGLTTSTVGGGDGGAGSSSSSGAGGSSSGAGGSSSGAGGSSSGAGGSSSGAAGSSGGGGGSSSGGGHGSSSGQGSSGAAGSSGGPSGSSSGATSSGSSGSSNGDGGSSNEAPGGSSSSGCSCDLPGASGSGSAFALGGAVAFGLVGSRLRRSRRSPAPRN
jgi:hypothetical protein